MDQILRVLQFENDSARVAQGGWYRSQDLNFLMQKAGARKDGMLAGNLQTVRRRNGDGYTYFINNRGEAVTSSIELDVKPVSVAVFDPMTGEAGLADWQLLASGKTRVHLYLRPWQSLIIRTYDRKTTGAKFRNFKESGQAISLSGDWQLKFLSGGPSLPPAVVQPQADYWNNFKDETYQSFSGTAEYSLKFNLEHPRSTDYYRLLLPEVRATAEVFLNGKKLCTLIGPDFSYAFPSTMLNARNEIRIVVSNLMANRIRYMDQHQLPWKIFYNTNMPARLKENSVNGLFSAASWPVMESGMKGEVRLQPLAVE